jgi:DNA-binding CsgD family transcriptional regulator
MSDRNTTRSSAYQYIINEYSTNPFVINDLSCAQGMIYRMQPSSYNEDFLDLKEQLLNRMWQIIDKGLTKRQKEVLKLSMEGLTQNEIAKILGINQTSVHKVLRGNIDYKTKDMKRRYGGAFKKISKLCQIDPEIQRILHEIQDINDVLEL